MAKRENKKENPKCPNCGGASEAQGGGQFICTVCRHEFSPEDE